MADDFLDNPFDDLTTPDLGPTPEVGGFDVTTKPSDLNRDELAESEWWRKFYNIFRPYIESQEFGEEDRLERMNAAKEWQKALTDYNEGKITLEDLKKVDVEIFSEIPGWNEYYAEIFGETTEESVDPFQSLYDKYGKEIVDDAKEKYDEIVKVLGEAAEDPFGAIEKIISTVSSGTTECTEANVPDWVRNCVTIGVLYGIPGLPLPPIPGVMGTTIGEIEEGFKKIGRNVQDIFDGAETCGEDTDGDGVGNEPCTWGEAVGRLGDWVLEKADEVLGDITNPDDIGDWVKGILGPVLGGLIFSEIGDQLEDIFFPVGDVDSDDTTKCTEGTLDSTTGLCICEDGSIEAEDGTCAEKQATVCEDPNATNYNQEGECQYSTADTDEEDTDQFGLSDTSSLDDLCGQPRPEQYGFGQVAWDQKCGGGAGTDSTDQSKVDCQENPQATPLECGWVECAGGGFAPTQEECGTDQEVVLGADSSSTDGGGGGGGGGGSSAFEGTVKGLSYQPQLVPGLLSGAPVDAMGELNQFISRQLQKRNKGMLT